MLAACKTPDKSLSDLLQDEAEAFLDHVSMAISTEGKARETNKEKARIEAARILVILAKSWNKAFGETLCDVLQPFLTLKGSTDE